MLEQAPRPRRRNRFHFGRKVLFACTPWIGGWQVAALSAPSCWDIQARSFVARGGHGVTWIVDQGAGCCLRGRRSRPTAIDLDRESASVAWLTVYPAASAALTPAYEALAQVNPATPGRGGCLNGGSGGTGRLQMRPRRWALGGPPARSRPKCVRIVSITGCSRIAAIVFNSSPRSGPCSRPISNTRLSSRAAASRRTVALQRRPLLAGTVTSWTTLTAAIRCGALNDRSLRRRVQRTDPPNTSDV